MMHVGFTNPLPAQQIKCHTALHPVPTLSSSQELLGVLHTKAARDKCTTTKDVFKDEEVFADVFARKRDVADAVS